MSKSLPTFQKSENCLHYRSGFRRNTEFQVIKESIPRAMAGIKNIVKTKTFKKLSSVFFMIPYYDSSLFNLPN